MRRFQRIVELVVAAAMLLTGCHWELPMTKFDEMEYVRPDVSDYRMLLEELLDEAEAGDDFAALDEALWDFTDCYNDYYTGYALANIRYCMDLTDIYWTDEYDFFMETSSEVDAGLDQLYYALADSPFREKLEGEDYFGEDFFDDYEGESLWDEEFTAQMEEEAELVSRYYELSTELLEADDAEYQLLTDEMCELYVELIAKRQEIAADAGYEDYAHFAYDFYYARDYTPEQEAAYIEQIQHELVPLYRYICTYGVRGIDIDECSEEETFEYVQQMAAAMGGTVEQAFHRMEEAELYDIRPGENKYEASFEIYIYNYNEPFVFVNPTQSSLDKLTFTHEFGHFCNDYASYGTGVGIDVAEIFSQGLEYLSLCYGEDTRSLEALSLANSLCVYVEQAAYASFERQAYELTGEELTVENVCGLFEKVAVEFGFDVWGVDSQFFAGVPHFYTNPMYVFSYVVSNDAAMQIYQLELEESGAGLAKYQENLDADETYFLAFLESAGLDSPFAEGRIQTVRETLEDALR